MNTGIVLLNVATTAAASTAAADTRSTIPGVIMLGLGMVFVGLICIVFLCKLMGWIVGAFSGKKTAEAKAPEAAQPAPVASAVTENRGEIIAAVSAAIAEELGTEVSALRIISFKKL